MPAPAGVPADAYATAPAAAPVREPLLSLSDVAVMVGVVADLSEYKYLVALPRFHSPLPRPSP